MPAATRYYKETLLLVIDQTRVVPDSRTWLSVHRLRDVSLRDSARTPTGGKGSFLFLTFPVTKNRTPSPFSRHCPQQQNARKKYIIVQTYLSFHPVNHWN